MSRKIAQQVAFKVKAEDCDKVTRKNKKVVYIYTDGACKGNPGPAGLGFVAIFKNSMILQYSEYIGCTTNNVAELQAIYRALQICGQLFSTQTPIVIVSDSKYALSVLNADKIKNLKKNKHYELLWRVRGMYRAFTYHDSCHVSAHRGDKYNEVADALASDACKFPKI